MGRVRSYSPYHTGDAALVCDDVASRFDLWTNFRYENAEWLPDQRRGHGD
jgi:hypothetical protein